MALPGTVDREPNRAASAGVGAAVEIAEVSRRFGDQLALDRVSLTIREGEFFSMLGPSGCGKTTLLRLIAGLDLPDGGRILIGGEDASALPAHRRPVNTVFQSYALFPHMTVRDNVAFGLRMKRVPEAEVRSRVDDAIDMVRIGPLAERKPAQLSGGQKQRVALARALINRPKVLLLDEPLGALDLKLRKELQVELLALQRQVGITFVFVTHDQEEALVLSDRIAVMRGGQIEQIGAAELLYEQPRTRFVAQFLGSCNLLEGVVSDRDGAALLVDTPLGAIRVAEGAGRAPGTRVTLAIRPEKLRQLDAPAAINGVEATLEEVIYSGSASEFHFVGPGGVHLRAQWLNSGGATLPPRGQTMRLLLPAEAIRVLDD